MILRLAVPLAITAFGAAAAQNGMVCLPSAPAAQAGSSITLKAEYMTQDGAAVTFKWSATQGQIRLSKGATIWDLRGARPGTAYADADAIINGTKAASCTVELRIEGEQAPSREVPQTSAKAPAPLPPPPPPPAPVVALAPAPAERIAITGRALLAPDQKEPGGFGLYSYILIGAPPAAADRDRYTAVFEAALRLLRPVEELTHYLKASQLNATWIPVKKLPANDPDPKWVVDNYDYSEGAANLVRAGIRNTPGGIYIISVRAPLGHATPARPFLVQDLTHVPAPLASTWVTLFINQAAQEHFWTPNAMDELVARMRLAIALSAEGFPPLRPLWLPGSTSPNRVF
jgi:hypothetical protein